MLRISGDDRVRRLVLEGSLSGPWVETLEDSWRAATARNAPSQITVDLTNVTFVDSAGKHLLAHIHKSGGGLLAIGLNLALVQEIVKC